MKRKKELFKQCCSDGKTFYTTHFNQFQRMGEANGSKDNSTDSFFVRRCSQIDETMSQPVISKTCSSGGI